MKSALLMAAAAALLGLGAGAAVGRASAGDAAPAGQPPGLALCTTLCRQGSAYAGHFVEHGACYQDGKVSRTVDSAEAASPNETHEQLLRTCPRP